MNETVQHVCGCQNKKGLEWVNTTKCLKDVIDRHYPEMTHKLVKSSLSHIYVS